MKKFRYVKGHVVDICYKVCEDRPSDLEVMCIGISSHAPKRLIGSYLLNAMKFQQRYELPFDHIEPMMIHRKFRKNRTERFGGLERNVFFTKFKMAENLSRRSLRVSICFL